MCLAVPGIIQTISEDELRSGTVAFGGITKDICLALVPDAQIGDYVIVHAGMAISTVDEQAAKITLALLEKIDHTIELESSSE